MKRHNQSKEAQGNNRNEVPELANQYHQFITSKSIAINNWINSYSKKYSSNLLQRIRKSYKDFLKKEDGDVPGWVLVVLMTTGLVTAIWTIAAPKLSSILKNSLDSMNGIR